MENDDLTKDDIGFKWSLSALCKHLESVGIDMDLMWSKIYDVIIKSLISGEQHILGALRRSVPHRSNCFELFGYDIMLDSNLKPWLIEINLSPSLACESPLDTKIKSTLLSDVLNIVGVKKFDRKRESQFKAKNRVRTH